MENIKLFLETSTIHGTYFISSTRKCVRLFWVLVVIGGFTGAGVMIYQSFNVWAESPVKTTIETVPIEEIKFPKVTVCPPKDTYTNLNYDLMTQIKTFDNRTQQELYDFAMDKLTQLLYDEMSANLSKLEDSSRYYNWYHGYAEIALPCPSHAHPPYPESDLYYRFHTYAKNGSISTKYFGESFDAKKVNNDIYYWIHIHSPENISKNENITLNIKIDTKLMNFDVIELYNGKDNTNKRSFSPPGKDINFKMIRKLSKDYISESSVLDVMPGFNLSWQFTEDFQPVAYYYENEDSVTNVNYKTRTKAFIRDCFNLTNKINTCIHIRRCHHSPLME